MDLEEQPQHYGGCKTAFLIHGTDCDKATRSCMLLTCMGSCRLTAGGGGGVSARCQVRMAAVEHDTCMEMGALGP